MLNTNFISRDVLFQIVETSVDAIVVINNRGIIDYVNEAVERMFLFNKTELIGNNVSMLMPKTDAAHHDGYINTYLQTGKAKIIGIGREVLCKRKDNTTFNSLLSISEIKNENVHLFTGIIHDISALKQAENQLLEANKHLEKRVKSRTKKLNKSLAKEKELSEMKSRFVSMASHEFRTPLSTILSSTNLLAKYIENGLLDKTENHLNKITKSVNHLNEVLSDFLLLGKWEEGKIKVEYSSFYLSTLYRELNDVFEINLKEQQTLLFKETPLIIHTDFNLLKNALMNIVSNSIKYSAEGSHIEVGVEETKLNVLIYVKDEGMGIPEHEKHQVFERFYRAGNINAIDGTGLGLSIVKLYMEKLNGKVWFESVIDKGTTFYIELPLNKTLS
ncbi:MAG: PAS domain-containing sensor histidine kinase [Chitinophagales bacterium]|nr:PAS domain-containing sensor histidine kinase [Chitinophagales bacterium]